jgi:peptide/nickel transport system substrate-binding protein
VRLSFANSTTSGAHLREQAQQFIQQTLAEIGVEMTISNLPSAVMFGDFWALSQFDTAISGITYLIGADPDVTNRFHTKSIAAQGGRGSNNAQYSNAEVDALLEEGSRTFDPEARREIYFRIQEIIRRDLPFLPLFANTGCSMVVAPFRDSQERILGAIGVIGPTRLNYARIIPLVDYTARAIGRMVG